MIKKLSQIYTIIVLTIPITAMYSAGIPGLSVADTLLIGIAILYLFTIPIYKKDILIILKNPLTWMFFYILFGTSISFLLQSNGYSIFESTTRIIRFGFYIFCALYLSKNLFNLKLFLAWYKKLVLFSTLYLGIQVVIYYTTGYFLQGTIPGLNFTNELYDFEASKNLLSDYYRPYSIFIEPGYYAIFVLPYLAYSLFKLNNNEKTNIYIAIFLTIGLMLSTSGQGLVIGIFIWILWFIKRTYILKTNKVRLLPIISIGIFAISLPIIFQIEVIQIAVDRLFNSPHASANLRIYRGFAVFQELENIFLFIGVGFGNVGAFIINNGIQTKYDVGLSTDYMNSIANIMVSLGIIGSIPFLLFFFKMFLKTEGFYRVMVLVLFLLSGIGGIFLSSTVIFYVSIILYGFYSKKESK